ncbi:MAG: hypothetical protein K7J46_01535 [Bryobacter sp.]|nr:hypothetical protein [Bryobacter sp. CoA8 C33]
MSILLAKQRTLHVFSDNGKSIPVSLRNQGGNIVAIESCQPIPVGVEVSWIHGGDSPRSPLRFPSQPPATGEERSLLEISVAFRP